ncbi:hypothetical protein [Rhizobium leguminosarum]|uniref:hypothetical protein n=1 Tax=Rhizobium leguminosarum TaxID=384 RepID=UPI001C915BDA|nr:hypothetical protein [Rhizobium leguminosarum]MBY2911344.1 hypothetical protein [Rhizobium leguminosarum]
MGTRIDELNLIATVTRQHLLPSMKDGATGRMTVGQILDLLIDGAPAALDTLNEIAAALNDDQNAFATLMAAIALKANAADVLALAGGTMSGDVNHGGFKILNALAIVDQFLFADPSAPTKRARLAVSGISAGQTRVLTMPDKDVDLGKMGWDFLGTKDLAGAAATFGEFLNLSAASYDQYKLEIINAVPATTASDIHLENSTNNGGAYGATADVNWRRSQQTTAAASTITPSSATGDTKIILGNNISNTANLAGFSGEVTVFPSAAARNRAIWSLSGHTGSNEYGGEGMGAFAAATNALRVRPSAGNWTSGRLNLYGIRH